MLSYKNTWSLDDGVVSHINLPRYKLTSAIVSYNLYAIFHVMLVLSNEHAADDIMWSYEQGANALDG